MAGMTVLPESGSFGVARVASWVFRYGDHNGQVRYRSYGQLHGRPGGGGHVVKVASTPSRLATVSICSGYTTPKGKRG